MDQVYPSDARRYEQSKLAKVGSYLLPSVHMLVPVSEHPYMIKDKFRRALLYATNRQEILRGELIGSDNPQDGRVLSDHSRWAPRANDPLNYAYDANIKPKPYEPRLAQAAALYGGKGSCHSVSEAESTGSAQYPAAYRGCLTLNWPGSRTKPCSSSGNWLA